METNLEDIVGRYVRRTEKAGSSYYLELVRSISESLTELGYKSDSEPENLRMVIRKLLDKEQEATLQAAHSRARQVSVSCDDIEDLVQEAWLRELERDRLKRPNGDSAKWAAYMRQKKSPVHIPLSVADKPGFQTPVSVSLNEGVHQYGGTYNSTAEESIDVRRAVSRLPLCVQADLKCFVLEEEHAVAYAKRKNISLAEAEEKKNRAIECLRQEIDGH